MTWMMVGSMAVTAVSSLMGSAKANKQATQQGIANSQQEAMQWDNNIAQNQAVQQTNLQNVIRTGYKIGVLNVQRAQAKKAAMQQGVDLSRSALSAASTAQANAAAAGAIGSSVAAVEQDIQMRVDEAGAQMGADFEVQQENFDTMLRDILLAGQDAQQAAVAGNVQASPPVNTTSFGESIAAAGVQVAGQYFNAKMQAGLSSKSVPDSALKPPAKG